MYRRMNDCHPSLIPVQHRRNLPLRDNTRDLFATLREMVRSWSDRSGHEDAYVQGSQARKDLAEQIRRYCAMLGREGFIKKVRAGLSGDGPSELEDEDAVMCAVCGKPLRTPLAKQCVQCGADWHGTDS